MPDKDKRKPLPKWVQDRLGAKISKVAKDHPEKSQKQRVGMAVGILKGEHEKRKD